MYRDKDRHSEEIQQDINRSKAKDKANEDRNTCKKLAARLASSRAELEKMRQRCAMLERKLALSADDTATCERLIDAANSDICLMQTRIENLQAKLKKAYILPPFIGKAMQILGLAVLP